MERKSERNRDRKSEDATVTGKGIKGRKALIPWPLYSFQRAGGAQISCHVGEKTHNMWSTMATITTLAHLSTSRVYISYKPMKKSPNFLLTTSSVRHDIGQGTRRKRMRAVTNRECLI